MNMRSERTLFIHDGKGARSWKSLASLGILLAIFAVAGSPGLVVAEERTCRGDLGGATVDNLRVPEGATCALNRTHVKGTVKVGPRATLYARGVRVEGNVQAENARLVSVTQSSRIGGSVQIKQGGSATVLDSSVRGDIQYEANHSSLRANNNTVGGNIQVIGNQARAEIYRNVIEGNLQCKENRPQPTGGRNKVRGNKENQCSAF
jgi:hypothetical protein